MPAAADALLPKSAMKPPKEAFSYSVSFDRLPRPVFWFNDLFETRTWSKRHVHDDWGELAYVGGGCMVMCTEGGSFLVRPDRAVWVPPGMPHEWYVPTATWDCSLYIAPARLEAAPNFLGYHVLHVTPLVRELIRHLCVRSYPFDDAPTGRLVDVLLDLLQQMPVHRDPLAMPKDPRLIELCSALITNPGDVDSLSRWAARLGISERNLTRIFHKETGTSFRQWRQTVRLGHAIESLRKGESVTSVALECGYSSLSAFIEAFKQQFGMTPGSVMRRRHMQPAAPVTAFSMEQCLTDME